jgi:hypothetical protein
MTTGTSAFTDAALVAGKSYTDPDYGITISVLSASAGALTVQVSAPGGTPGVTTTTVTSSPNPSTTGASVTFTASVIGNAPTGTVLFTDKGVTIAGCAAVALAGSTNTRTAMCTTSALAAGSHAIVAQYAGNAGNAASTSAALTQTVNAAASETNVALASAGGVATASSTSSAYYPAGAVNNNDRKGAGSGGRWKDATSNAFPDWVQIAFNGSKTIDRVVVYSVQDNFNAPVEPTDTMTFSKYGIKGFQVQGWNGSAWVTLATVSNSNLVKRAVTFTAYTTSKIRISTTAAGDGYSRIVEIEAWGH